MDDILAAESTLCGDIKSVERAALVKACPADPFGSIYMPRAELTHCNSYGPFALSKLEYIEPSMVLVVDLT